MNDFSHEYIWLLIFMMLFNVIDGMWVAVALIVYVYSINDANLK